MDCFFLGHPGLDEVQKPDELLMAMALHALADDLALKDIERREQGGDAMALVIMGHGASASLLHRQAWLGAIKRLNLAPMGIFGSRSSDQDSMIKLRSLIRIQGRSPLP